jgi:DNA polymerase-1
MELAGVRLNVARLAEVGRRVRDEVATLEREIWDLAGRGVRHRLAAAAGRRALREARPVAQAPREDRLLDRRPRAAGDPRRAPVIPKIERWRELNQLVKTYLDVLPQLVDRESRIHTTFVQAVATTGRLSSTDPNMQNVPVRTELGREIRGCFEAAPGHVLTSADYSQVELRVLAHVADEPVLKEIFLREEDVHTATASQVFGKDPSELTPMDRSKSKMINYGIVYGLSDFGLADRLNIAREEAKAFIDAYLERFTRVAAFMASTIEQATEQGYVTTLFGRRRQIPELRGAQLAGAQARRAPCGQHGDPGHRRRRAQAGDDPQPPRAGRRGAGDAPDPHDPRRAAVRGPGVRGRRRARAGAPRDGGPVGAARAAAGRGRRDGPTWLEAK